MEEDDGGAIWRIGYGLRGRERMGRRSGLCRGEVCRKEVRERSVKFGRKFRKEVRKWR